MPAVGQELYFERDDKLGRKRYAEFLKNLILNSSAFKREDERKAFSIAIDSPWGTGKSYFLNMFRNYLCTEKDCDMAIVMYNAWENDNWNNAFEPLAQTLFEAFDLFEGDQKLELENAVKAIAILARGVAAKKVEKHISEDALCEAIEAITKENPKKNIASREYLAYKEMVKRLRECIAQGLKRSGKKQLVVIIDELDRCRPDFAVQTMEFVKHLFDAENVVFLFALDMSQLRHSIKSIYGEGMDAEGYLIRFFDYYGRLATPDVFTFVQHILEADAPNTNFYIPPKFLPKAISTIKEFNLSLRDIKTVLRVYIQMNVCFLYQYKAQYAHELYFTMLCIKYKRPGDYASLISSKNPTSGLWRLFHDRVQDFFKNGDVLDHVKKDVIDRNGNVLHRVCEMDYRDCGSRKKEQFTILYERNPVELVMYTLDETDSIDNFLFYPDLKKWDQIKDLTPAQYLMQQLEMFDFFQPRNQ